MGKYAVRWADAGANALHLGHMDMRSSRITSKMSIIHMDWLWSCQKLGGDVAGQHGSGSHDTNANIMRSELGILLGIRWNAVVAWIVLAWLSLWLWRTILAGQLFDWGSGPVTFIADAYRSLGDKPPGWLASMIGWLLDPAHDALTTVFVLIAVVSIVSAVRCHRHAGLRSIAWVSTAFASEVAGRFWPVVAVLALSSIPGVIAGCIALVSSARSTDARDDEALDDMHRGDARAAYRGRTIVIYFIARVAAVLLAPLAAPALLMVQLVTSFRSEAPFEPARDILRTIGSDAPETKADIDPLTRAAATAAIQLAGNDSREARGIVTDFSNRLEQRRRQRARLAEDERRRANPWMQR